MENIKQYINHPLSKCIIAALVGGGLLLEGHLFYGGVGFGYGLRELFLAFKSE
tara:strand:- start:160 stop:318 length:159 start_codon:yes stop_codon:yes gene_type:complete